ncbi:MAG: hypothetical protein GPJ50_03880 [Candidatus Heimdallarchaeota archaeon]|nr:hypothetical protein [Candidatus Heimdallarchaeota archaeon]
MRITKEMLEEQLQDCRQKLASLQQERQLLASKLEFISKLIPNQSMIVAMERMTDALAHTIQHLTKR